MATAEVWAERATCPRKHVGVVIVREGKVIATGYNGAPSGLPHCESVGCDVDAAGHCTRAVHAEMNAILQCALHGVSTRGAWLYTTLSPCMRCAMAIINAGIAGVVFKTKYDGDSYQRVAAVFKAVGVKLLDQNNEQ